MYDSHPNNYATAEAYPPRMSQQSNRHVDYCAKPQIRPHQPVSYNQTPIEIEYHRSGSAGMVPSSSSSNSIFPRSASEALFDTTSKFRQLPCRTFISVGTCPYRERCVYLHDPRCICKEAKTKTRRKNKEDVVLDALFWPVMPYPMVAAKLDMNRQPHVIQSYSVPLPQPDQYRKHDVSVYSMWMHFVDFCLATSESNNVRRADAAPCYSAPDVPINSYSEESRLKFFQFLSSSNGRPVSREEILQVAAMHVPGASMRPYPAHAHQQQHQQLNTRRAQPQQQQQYAEEAVNPYFTSSDAPLVDVMEPSTRGYNAPHMLDAAQSQAHFRPVVAPVSSASFPPKQRETQYGSDAFAHLGLQVNTSMGGGGGGGGVDQRSLNSSSTSSPITVAASGSTGEAHSRAALQSRVAIGGALSALNSSGGVKCSPTSVADAPTSLSLLMSTVPQSSLSHAMEPTKLGRLQIMSRSDPWLEKDVFGATDEERDSGSSSNSVPQDFRSLWKADDDAVAALSLSLGMINDFV